MAIPYNEPTKLKACGPFKKPEFGDNEIIMAQKIANFLKDTRLELKKVTWPTKQETVNYTLMVIVVSLALALFLGGLDYIFQWILNKFVL